MFIVHVIRYNDFTFQTGIQLIQSADKMTIRFDFFQQMVEFNLILNNENMNNLPSASCSKHDFAHSVQSEFIAQIGR